MTLFVSTSVYALAKRLGLEAADREFKEQVKHPTGKSLGCARVVNRLHRIAVDAGDDGIHLRVDLGVGTAAKMRSRMADYAWKSGADVWVSVDDDVDADQVALESALKVVRSTRGVVTVPYRLRRPITGEEVGSCDLVEPVLVRVVAGAAVARSNVGGFGLVFVHREALELVRRDGGAPLFCDLDDDGSTRPALFAELNEKGRWYGEDWSFFLRLPRAVQVDALLDGITNHDGRVMHCKALLELPRPKFSAPELDGFAPGGET